MTSMTIIQSQTGVYIEYEKDWQPSEPLKYWRFFSTEGVCNELSCSVLNRLKWLDLSTRQPASTALQYSRRLITNDRTSLVLVSGPVAMTVHCSEAIGVVGEPRCSVLASPAASELRICRGDSISVAGGCRCRAEISKGCNFFYPIRFP